MADNRCAATECYLVSRRFSDRPRRVNKVSIEIINFDTSDRISAGCSLYNEKLFALRASLFNRYFRRSTLALSFQTNSNKTALSARLVER